MGNIVVLDELTINQIAAGEVIERPANVVKELVENSIDAGATSIAIEIKNGGITYIRITDNGKGVEKDDIKVAFERHATSKIRSSKDLSNIMTMGFRGEALASIASVADVELISCTQNSDIGNRIVVKAGDILEYEEYGCPKGTTITVKDLFFNTPVRYKFLKKDFTEAGYIEDIVTKLALIHPEISFKLISKDKQIVSTNGNSDMVSVIYSIFGKEISDNVIPVDYTYENMRITGMIGKPQIARSNRSNQIMYINGRNIKDKTISAAIDEAYRTIIPNGKFAFTVINLEMPPQLVDVNVHPAKLEIRFQKEQDVFKAVFHATKHALLANDLSRDVEKAIPIEQQDIVEQKQDNYVYEQNQNIKEGNTVPNVSEVNEKSKYNSNYESLEFVRTHNIPTNVEKNIQQEVEQSTKELQIEKQEIAANISIFDKENKEEAKKEFKYIGTAFDTYNIIEYLGEMYIIDQHAAHERVLYEQVKQGYYSDNTLSQMLLIPEVITLTNKEAEMIKQDMTMFEKAGYVLEEFGDNSFKIVGVPYICMDINVKDLFLDILDEMQGNRTAKDEIEEKFLSTIACKAAVKANMNLKDEEVIALIEQVLELENPFTCPHGRPTAIKMSKYDLERKFGRK